MGDVNGQKPGDACDSTPLPLAGGVGGHLSKQEKNPPLASPASGRGSEKLETQQSETTPIGFTKPLLVVTGTQREGALATGPGVIVLAGGGNAAQSARDLARLAPTACGIISFGTGGGLVPGLRLGDMVIGSTLTGALTRDCDAPWVQALARALPLARIGTVFADGTLLATAEAKANAAISGAIIADMESHIAGAAAARAGLPFAILRCVSDLADAILPPAVACAMRPDGSLALGAVFGSILRRPGQLPALICTGASFGRAFAVLQDRAGEVGPRLGIDRRGFR